MTVEIVEFVMGDQRTSQSSVYSLPIDLRYRPGRYGWNTDSPKYTFDGGVQDAEDASFVIDLPNGNISSVVSFNRTGFVPIVLVFTATISDWGYHLPFL